MNDFMLITNPVEKVEFLTGQLDYLEQPYMVSGNYLIVTPTTSPLYETLFPTTYEGDGIRQEHMFHNGIMVLVFDLELFTPHRSLDFALNIEDIASTI